MSVTQLRKSILLVALTSIASVSFASEEAPQNSIHSCATDEYRQFDFFIGDWDAYDVSTPDKVIARNRVDVILEGCVVHEDYDQNDGHHGESYSVYDVARGMWHQSWVTNRGELLLLDGALQAGRMTLTGTERNHDGKSSLLRGVWLKQADGVRETATRSIDGGKSWQPVFDILFRPHQR